MDTETNLTSATAAKLRAVTTEDDPESRTQASIQPSVTLSVVDIDQQSAQFACELTISNVADDDFQVGQIRPRLPAGVTLNEALDSAQAERLRTYVEICRSMEAVLTTAVLINNEQLFKQQVTTLRETVKSLLRGSGILDFYWSLLLRRTPEVMRQARERSFKVTVRCADDIGRVIKMFPLGAEGNADIQLARYNMQMLIDMEQSEDFKQSQQDVTLKRGQQYKIVYILRGTRGYINSLPFSISFEIPFRRGSYAISRMEYVRISVPPGSTWPTLTAMFSAAIGSYIQRFGTPDASAPADVTRLGADAIVNGAVATLLVPMLTALVVYNIYDLTTLKEKFQTKRGWRSAVLVGFFCGFLNQKILAALAVLFR
jgi:hypothetical protein